MQRLLVGLALAATPAWGHVMPLPHAASAPRSIRHRLSPIPVSRPQAWNNGSPRSSSKCRNCRRMSRRAIGHPGHAWPRDHSSSASHDSKRRQGGDSGAEHAGVTSGAAGEPARQLGARRSGRPPRPERSHRPFQRRRQTAGHGRKPGAALRALSVRTHHHRDNQHIGAITIPVPGGNGLA